MGRSGARLGSRLDSDERPANATPKQIASQAQNTRCSGPFDDLTATSFDYVGVVLETAGRLWKGMAADVDG
jgi:hypothetical protein